METGSSTIISSTQSLLTMISTVGTMEKVAVIFGAGIGEGMRIMMESATGRSVFLGRDGIEIISH